MADSDCLAGRSFQLPVVHESLELFRVSEILAGISSAFWTLTALAIEVRQRLEPWARHPVKKGWKNTGSLR